jgi:hypothetical protein
MSDNIDWGLKLSGLPELLTVRQTKEVIGVCRKEVGRLVKRGLLVKHPSFVKSRIYKYSVIEFLAAGGQ